MAKLGEDYEIAVFDFAKTLDPNAEVLFDHHVPDRDTGQLRQCDVWINARFGNFFPLSFYVSCKKHSRKLHQGDIDYFFGELYSRQATNGVIYSKIGFTKPALKKAEKLGISCCRLLKDEPIDIKSILLFSHFACYPTIGLKLHNYTELPGIETWNDLFNIIIDNKKVVDYIEEVYLDAQSKVFEKTQTTMEFPSYWENNIQIYEPTSNREVSLKIIGQWKIFTAKDEAILYNGSYCYNGPGSYRGSFTGPAIDTRGDNPGHEWQQLNERNILLPTNRIVFIPHAQNIKRSLIENIGETRVKIGN